MTLGKFITLNIRNKIWKYMRNVTRFYGHRYDRTSLDIQIEINRKYTLGEDFAKRSIILKQSFWNFIVFIFCAAVKCRVCIITTTRVSRYTFSLCRKQSITVTCRFYADPVSASLNQFVRRTWPEYYPAILQFCNFLVRTTRYRFHENIYE